MTGAMGRRRAAPLNGEWLDTVLKQALNMSINGGCTKSVELWGLWTRGAGEKEKTPRLV